MENLNRGKKYREHAAANGKVAQNWSRCGVTYQTLPALQGCYLKTTSKKKVQENWSSGYDCGSPENHLFVQDAAVPVFMKYIFPLA